MKTLILTSILFIGMNVMAQQHEWIELRYSVSASKYQVLVVGNFKPYGLETDDGERVNNIPIAIEVMEGRGFEYMEIYPITADPGLGVTIYYTCVLMRKLPNPVLGFAGSEPSISQMLSNYSDTTQVETPGIVEKF